MTREQEQAEAVLVWASLIRQATGDPLKALFLDAKLDWDESYKLTDFPTMLATVLFYVRRQQTRHEAKGEIFAAHDLEVVASRLKWAASALVDYLDGSSNKRGMDADTGRYLSQSKSGVPGQGEEPQQETLGASGAVASAAGPAVNQPAPGR